jgi:hypothetical protein
LRLLIIYTGDYGLRHLENVRQHAPAAWSIETWKAPERYPLVIDYPEDFLPAELPACDLLVSFAEAKGVAELLPEIAAMTGAKAVLAPVDNEAWLPRGLARQLRGWLERMGVACATPKPLCSLSENEYWLARSQKVAYQDAFISEFARYFGRPVFEINVDAGNGVIASASVQRDAVCGCARFVAEGLAGLTVDEAGEKAGLLHHHFPCLASMGIDSDFGDTLMHVSGNLLKDEVNAKLRPYQDIRYLKPGNLSE